MPNKTACANNNLYTVFVKFGFQFDLPVCRVSQIIMNRFA